MQSSAAVTADTAGLLCSRCSRSRRPQAAQAAAELQTKHQGPACRTVWAVRVHLSDGACDTVWLWSLPGTAAHTSSEQWSRIENCPVSWKPGLLEQLSEYWRNKFFLFIFCSLLRAGWSSVALSLQPAADSNQACIMETWTLQTLLCAWLFPMFSGCSLENCTIFESISGHIFIMILIDFTSWKLVSWCHVSWRVICGVPSAAPRTWAEMPLIESS